MWKADVFTSGYSKWTEKTPQHPLWLLDYNIPDLCYGGNDWQNCYSTIFGQQPLILISTQNIVDMLCHCLTITVQSLKAEQWNLQNSHKHDHNYFQPVLVLKIEASSGYAMFPCMFFLMSYCLKYIIYFLFIILILLFTFSDHMIIGKQLSKALTPE